MIEIEVPIMLRVKMRDTEAFDEAVRQGYIQRGADGHLQWMLGNKTLLAYFMGRLFCGDSSQSCPPTDKKVWRKGRGSFPDKMICRLFGIKHLKQSRERRSYLRVPDCAQLIDRLFNREEK